MFSEFNVFPNKISTKFSSLSKHNRYSYRCVSVIMDINSFRFAITHYTEGFPANDAHEKAKRVVVV